MAINSISDNKGGGNVSLVNINNKGEQLESIKDIVGSIRDDIKNIKDQFNNLPTAPNGKLLYFIFLEKPPSPLARF